LDYDEIRSEALAIGLSSMQHPEALKTASSLASDKSGKVRAAAYRVLGQHGTDRAIEVLESRLRADYKPLLQNLIYALHFSLLLAACRAAFARYATGSRILLPDWVCSSPASVWRRPGAFCRRAFRRRLRDLSPLSRWPLHARHPHRTSSARAPKLAMASAAAGLSTSSRHPTAPSSSSIHSTPRNSPRVLSSVRSARA
jgi:hypothetical protein